MRLTLRTLLAYLDDTLPADQAQEIGRKVAESHVAQELMERIKKVTRRRGLTIPPAAGPDRIDANVVAEYLDNDLPADRVAEVEETALNSDVHLAEIAACHQILTLVLGEPAQVPPTARERMYGLVQGKESEPHRRASRIGPPAFPGDVELPEERQAARRGAGFRLLGAGILGAALGVAIWQSLPSPTTPTQSPTTVVDAGTKPATEPQTTPPPPDPEPSIKPPVPMPDTKPPMPEPGPVTPPMPPKQPIDKPPDRSPSPEKKDVAQFSSRDAVLLTRQGDAAWSKVAPDAKVQSGVSLLALPGSHAELKFDSGARLTLWGGLHDTTGWKLLDSEVTLHVPPAGFDLDFTLNHGRVFAGTSKKGAATKVRIRFAGEIWDVTLADDQSEIVMDVSTLFAGEAFRRDGKGESPRTEAMLGAVQGKAMVKVDAREFALQAPPGPAELVWNNKGAGIGKPIDVQVLPAAWSKTLLKTLSRQRQSEIEDAQKKLLQRISTKDKSADLAIAELFQDGSRAAKVLSVFSQSAMGALPPLLDALEEPQFPEVRLAAAIALAQLAARQPASDQQIFEQLQGRKAYGERQLEQAERLLHGFNEAQIADPATFEFLIDALRSDQMGIRELAAWRLRQLDPEGADRIRFNAADTDVNRDKAVGDWQKRIPAGKLPPPRANPQGRAPSKSGGIGI